MSDDDDTNDIDALERLDRALDRIEAGARQPAVAVPAAVPGLAPDLTEVAARLDAVIARLRAELEA